MSRGLTPSQTVGPFYWGTLVKTCHAELAPPGVAGERIELALSLHDIDGAIVPDGVLEIWQANSHGRYNHPDDRRNLPLDAGFEGFGRASTDPKGVARFGTVRPGRVPWPEGGLQAAHVNVSVFARGISCDDIKYEGTVHAMNRPIKIGNVTINNGDYIYADDDGVLAIPAALWPSIRDEAMATLKKEFDIRYAIIMGEDVGKVLGTHGAF